ncbi:VIT domain-containing protein [Tenacibaculum sp. 190524A05c]|uniref:VIT domain-containing protein n=1 Tax=Tenacibaculum platacis TaxID=3137852 RepID=UPI0031FAE8EC
MKKIILITLLLLSCKIFSQNIPKITIEEEKDLKLSDLKIKVNITGNSAFTTYDMTFYNGHNRTLEGELAFPLGQGQSVYKLAMDLNGSLREAVIVEKELARVAYETTVRQNIDPVLLEKTAGNNYKARVYPIFPKSHKRVVLTYEEKLTRTHNNLLYELPLGITDSIDNFSVDIEITDNSLKPIITCNSISKFNIKTNTKTTNISTSQQNFIPKNPIKIVLTNTKNTIANTFIYEDYFYSNIAVKSERRKKIKPTKVSLLWDVSYSMKFKNLKKELQLLENYINYLQNVEIHFITFNSNINKKEKIQISNGNWEQLKSTITSLTYDGGTNLESLKNLKLDANEVLLFTDGLANLGDLESLHKKTIYTINSLTSANHFYLNTIATKNGGIYINLRKQTDTSALTLLQEERLQFLGYKTNDKISEVYPKGSVNITDDFVISGRFKSVTPIELQFGFQGQVSKTIQINLNDSKKSNQVKRLWAKEKLNHLNITKENNRNEIISLSKQYHLITDYTSMLILDRIEDYVRYKIEPPKELRAQYKKMLAAQFEYDKIENQDILDRKEEIFEDYEDIIEWHNKRFSFKKKNHKNTTREVTSREVTNRVLYNETNTDRTNSNINTTNNNNTSNTSNTNSQNTSSNTPTTTNESSTNLNIDNSKNVISGVISDESGPLPGVSVLIKGTTQGTETDFDGKYAINAKAGDILIYSFVGLKTQEKVVGASNNINTQLESDNLLDEVVVVGYGTSVRKSITNTSVAIALAGEASGLKVNNSNTEEKPIRIRGIGNITNEQPLFILDGKIVSSNPIRSLKSSEVSSVQVYKPAEAVKIYGSRAVNGVVIFITKKGLEINSEEIESLNKLIEDKIELKAWDSNTPYLEILRKENSIAEAYRKYLKIRSIYSNSPMFFIDVADFFDKKGSRKLAIQILTNLIEIDLDNYELIKALAYKLEYFKEYDLAKKMYKKVLELRPEEPQSYRDLALAYEFAGDYQKSFDLLFKIYNGELLSKDTDERFYGIESIAFVELTRLVNKYGNKLKLNRHQKKFFKPLPIDIRIVVDWNHNDTDIDLWVIDPNNEKAYYNNKETTIGSFMSDDMTEGYGPEQYMLKKAIKGKYKIMIDYFADNVQKISGPTILKVSMYMNYGKRNEKKETLTVKLDKQDDYIEVGSLFFK